MCVRLFDAYQAGRHEEARELQRRLIPIAQAVTSGHGVAGLKAGMEAAGYIGGNPRSPLGPASAEGVRAIREMLTPLQEFL